MDKTKKKKKRSKKNKTRKLNKGGLGERLQKLIRTAAQTTAKFAAVRAAAANPYKYLRKPLKSKLIEQFKKEAVDQTITLPLNDKFNQPYIESKTKSTGDDKSVISKEPPISRTFKEEIVKFSELASGNWKTPAFILREKIFQGQELHKKKVDLIKKIEQYNNIHLKPDEKIKTVFGTAASFLVANPDYNRRKLKKEIETLSAYIYKQETISNDKYRLGIEFDSIQNKFNYTLPYKFERQGTFTWNLLNNIDISYKEIHNSYCKKWNKWTPETEPEICKTDITSYKEISVFAVNTVIDVIVGFVTSLGKVDESSSPTKTTKSIPYYGNVYVPILGLGLNINALTNTIYSAVSGNWDTMWLNNILGIITPIVSDIFTDIGNSKETGLDIVSFLLSKFTLLSEENIDKIINDSRILKPFKKKLENFLIKNHTLFIIDYKKTQFIGRVSKELQFKIREFKEEFIHEIQSELKRNFMALILYGAELDGIYDDFYEKNLSEIN